jgi:hypothetical protein
LHSYSSPFMSHVVGLKKNLFSSESLLEFHLSCVNFMIRCLRINRCYPLYAYARTELPPRAVSDICF